MEVASQEATPNTASNTPNSTTPTGDTKAKDESAIDTTFQPIISSQLSLVKRQGSSLKLVNDMFIDDYKYETL